MEVFGYKYHGGYFLPVQTWLFYMHICFGKFNKSDTSLLLSWDSFCGLLSWNVSQMEIMVTLPLWNFSRTLSHERQCKCNIFAYQDRVMIKTNHYSFYPPDICLCIAYLDIIDVLEVHHCRFLGVYKYAWKFFKILWDKSSKKTRLQLIRARFWSII